MENVEINTAKITGGKNDKYLGMSIIDFARSPTTYIRSDMRLRTKLTTEVKKSAIDFNILNIPDSIY